MKQFDMKRFGLVLKLDFAEGRKAMMWGTLCMLLLYLFFFWFIHQIWFNDTYPIVDRETYLDLQTYRISRICEEAGTLSAMAMYIYFLIAASTLYVSEQRKEKRIAWLMLPASNLEKFLSRWVYLLVFSLTGGLLSFFGADMIHAAYLWMADYPVMTVIDDFFLVMPHVPEGASLNDYLRTVMMMTFCLAIHAYYLLGGVFFKRFHFIAVTAVMAVGFTAFAAVVNALQEPGHQIPDITVHYSSVTVFWIMFITLCTWLAYRLFCRWQVVTRKFANV